MIIYRRGNLTADNFTPRPGKDTVAKPGQTPGLSLSESPAPGTKVHGIDLDLLSPPLAAFPDDTKAGGTPGHVAIAPVDQTGEIDMTSLQAWASARGSGQTHEFTQILLDAVVEPNKKGS